MEPSIPYVGFSAFGHPSECDAVRAAIRPERLLMFGALMYGDPREWNPYRSPKRCPKYDVLSTIFQLRTNVLHLLHFGARPDCDLSEDLCLAHERAGQHCDGIQVNEPAFPDPRALRHYKERFKSTIALACQPDAIRLVDRDPKKLVEKLKEYTDLIEYVLIDESAGAGHALNPSFLDECYREISAAMPHVTPICCGGLHAGNVAERVGPLARKFRVGTDAEGALRTLDDTISVRSCIRYGQRTDALLAECGY